MYFVREQNYFQQKLINMGSVGYFIKLLLVKLVLFI